MHIPDNYLSPTTCATLWAVMVPVWRKASGSIKKELTKERLPLLAVSASFSFLIMMFNLPLPGGTTGHVAGAALIAILLGPYSAVISVTVALAIQALFFGDGGLLAFGANTFNLAFVMPFTAYYIFNLIKGKREGSRISFIAAFAAAYTALNIAALLTAVELGIQPYLFKDAAGMPLYCPYGLSASIPAMLLPHLFVVGLVEGFVTSLVYGYVKKLSPDMIYKNDRYNAKPVYGLLAALAILSPLGLIASGTAWGEWDMQKGFNFKSLMPDYTVLGLSPVMSYWISAAAGLGIIFIVFKLVGQRTAKTVKK